MDADAGAFLDHLGADLDEALPEGGEIGPGERDAARHGIAQGEHQPVGNGVQDEAELVGDQALAGRPVRVELDLVLLDQVLDLAAGAVEPFEEMAGLSAERGDDVSRVEAARTCLHLGGVGELDEAAHPIRAGLGAAHPEIVGDLVGEAVQRGVARQPEDVVDAVLLAPVPPLAAGVMGVSPAGEPGARPVPADAANKMLEQGADFGA